MGNNLFKNARKSAPNHPDWKGEVTTPDGKTWELAGWISTDKATGEVRADKNGNPWLSIKASAPRAKDDAPATGGGGYPARNAEPPADPLGGDEIPFGFADYGTFPNF